MFFQGQMMNPNEGSCGCNQGCPSAVPTCQQCNQVVQTCNVQDVPHYINYHTHEYLNLTNIIKKINGSKPFFVFKRVILKIYKKVKNIVNNEKYY